MPSSNISLSHNDLFWRKSTQSHWLKRLVVFATYIVLLALSMQFNLFSQQTGGGYSESYLLRNVGARAISMAGAFSAVSNDPTALFYNPAGLSSIGDMPVFTSSVSTLSFGRNQAILAWGQNITEEIGVGAAVNSLFTDAFMGRNIRGEQTVSMTDMQTSINIGASYSKEFMSLGVALRYMRNDLMGSDIQGQGFGLDIGTKFNVFDMFSVGVSMQNVTSLMIWNTPSNNIDNVPYLIRAGIATEYGFNEETYTTRSSQTGELEKIYLPPTEYIMVTFEAMLRQNDLDPTFVFATEIVPDEMIALRGGISIYGDDMGTARFFPMNVWGAGISIRPGEDFLDLGLPFDFNIDYAVTKEFIAELGISHNITLVFKF